MTRADILKLLPHEGAMCLLDEVTAWDADSLHARSRRYAQADNPLRDADGTLGTAACIEIAAQAMALHGRLTAPVEGTPRPGFLVSLREVRLATARLDDAGPLDLEVRRMLGDSRGAAYDFSVHRGAAEIAAGRATVLFEAPA